MLSSKDRDDLYNVAVLLKALEETERDPIRKNGLTNARTFLNKLQRKLGSDSGGASTENSA